MLLGNLLIRLTRIQKKELFYFGYNFTPTSSSFQKLIFDSNSLDVFFENFNNTEKQLGSQIFPQANLKLAQLISKNSQSFNSKTLPNVNYYLVQSLNKIDLNNISLQEYSMNLSLIKSIKFHGLKSPQISNFFSKVFTYLPHLIEKITTNRHINPALDIYQKICFLKRYQCEMLAKSIISILNNDDQRSKQISSNHLRLISTLDSMTKREKLGQNEKKLLHNILRNIQDKKHLLSISNLVQIGVTLSKFVINDNDKYIQKYIYHQINDNLHELEQNHVLNILKSSQSRNPQFLKIYDTIVNGMFAQLQSDQNTNLSDNLILYFFQLLSRKYNIQRFSEKQKEVFWSQFSRISSNKENNILILRYLPEIVQNRFFNRTQLIRLQKLFHTKQITMNLNLAAFFSLNHLKITNIKDILQQQKKTQNILLFCYYAVIMTGQQSLNPQDQYLQNQKQQVIKYMKNNPLTQKDLSYIMVKTNNYEMLRTLYNKYSQYFFKQLQNPFNHPQESYSIKINYLLFICHVIPWNVSIILLKEIIPKINCNELNKLHEYQKQGSIITKSNVLYIYLCKFADIINEKHKNSLNSLIIYLQRHIFRAGFSLYRYKTIETIWQIFYATIEALKDNNPRIKANLLNIIAISFISQAKHRLNYAKGYRVWLIDLINNFKYLNNQWIRKVIIKECLQHNLIKLNQHEQLFKLINYSQMTGKTAIMLKITQKDYKDIQNLSINERNLVYYLKSGINSAQLQKIEGMQQLIYKMASNELKSCLIHYNYGHNEVALKIYRLLCNKLANGLNKNSQNISIIIDIIQNAKINKLSFVHELKFLVEKWMQNCSINIQANHVQDHLQFLEIGQKIKILNPSYYSNLLQSFMDSFSNIQIIYKCIFIGINLSHKFTFNQSLILLKIYKKHPSLAIQIFLLLQYNFSQDESLSLIEKLLKHFHIIALEHRNIKKSSFEYLKIKYPTLMKTNEDYNIIQDLQDIAIMPEIQQIFKIIQSVSDYRFQRKMISENSCYYQIKNTNKKIITIQKNTRINHNEVILYSRKFSALYEPTTPPEDWIILNSQFPNIKIVQYLADNLNLTSKEAQLQILVQKMSLGVQQKND